MGIVQQLNIVQEMEKRGIYAIIGGTYFTYSTPIKTGPSVKLKMRRNSNEIVHGNAENDAGVVQCGEEEKYDDGDEAMQNE